MTDRRVAAVLLLVVYLWTPLEGADQSVTCQLSTTCSLSCLFNPGPEVVIHWLHPPDDSSFVVHTFYHNADQLARQKPRYKGRTALSRTQMAKGDASLQLSGVQVADRGRYKCYTSTTRGSNEAFINVNVQAPVGVVRLSEDGQTLSCSAEGVYPKPSVSWSPSSGAPPTFTPAESGVWSVLGSVSLPRQGPHEYSCNVSTPHSWRSATYRTNDPVSVSGQDSISCSGTKSPIKSLLWTFNRTETVLNWTGPDLVYNSDWRTRVELDSGSDLVLKNLNQDHQGLYTCFLTTDDHFYLTVTEVNVKADHTKVIVSVVVVVGVLLLVVIGFLLFKRRHRRNKNAV